MSPLVNTKKTAKKETKTPLRYAGGKTKAIKILSSHLEDIGIPDKIISPFIGGGSLESVWSSKYGVKVEGYDVFHALVNFWQQLLVNPRELSDFLETLPPTKEKYAEVKELLMCWNYTQEMLAGWRTDYYVRDPINLSSLESAGYYFFNHNLSYGPMYLGWMSKIYENQDKWDKCVRRVREYSNPMLSVSEASFEEVIENNSKEFLYLDPPYLLEKDADNKMFKGIYPNANIDVHHSSFNHELLRDLLLKHKGQFMLSYNNCETIREYYSDFELYYPNWHYSYALGETRIGKNKQEVGNAPKQSHEILVIKR